MAKQLTFNTNFINPKATDIKHIINLNNDDIVIGNEYILSIIIFGKSANQFSDELLNKIVKFQGVRCSIGVYDNFIEGMIFEDFIETPLLAEKIGKINYGNNPENLKLNVVKKIVIAELNKNGYPVDSNDVYITVSLKTFSNSSKIFLKLDKDLPKNERYNIVAYGEEIFKKLNINFGLTDKDGNTIPGKQPLYFGHGYQLKLIDGELALSTDYSYNNFFKKDVIYDSTEIALDIVIQK